jgi:gamma-glutamyltranspeptidase / glutathione hydrolase
MDICALADIPTERLLSKAYAAERRALIDLDRAAQSVDPGAALRDGDTIYLTTADKDGNMVSLIQSNYRGMGAGVRKPHRARRPRRNDIDI